MLVRYRERRYASIDVDVRTGRMVAKKDWNEAKDGDGRFSSFD